MLVKVYILFIIGLILHVSAYSISPLAYMVGAEIDKPYWFFLLCSLCYCCYMGAFYYIAPVKKFRALILFALALYLSNVLDVLFFDRKEISINEYIGAIAAAIISYLEYKDVDLMIKVKVAEWLKHIKFVEK